jgi:hypothetical protein
LLVPVTGTAATLAISWSALNSGAVGDVLMAQGQQSDAGYLGGFLDAEALDAEEAHLLADVLTVEGHEGLDVVGLAVSRAGLSKLPDEVTGRVQMLEPLVSGDGVLGRLEHIGDRRTLRCGADRPALARALPDPGLNYLQCPLDLR